MPFVLRGSHDLHVGGRTFYPGQVVSRTVEGGDFVPLWGKRKPLPCRKCPPSAGVYFLSEGALATHQRRVHVVRPKLYVLQAHAAVLDPDGNVVYPGEVLGHEFSGAEFRLVEDPDFVPEVCAECRRAFVSERALASHSMVIHFGR